MAPLGALVPALSPQLGLLETPRCCPDRANGNRGVLRGRKEAPGRWKRGAEEPGLVDGADPRPSTQWCPQTALSIPPPKPSSASLLPAASPSLAGCCTPQVPLRVPKPGQASPSPLGPSPALPPNIPLPSVPARGLALLPAGTGWAGGLLRTLISPLRPPLSPAIYHNPDYLPLGPAGDDKEK